MLQIDQIVVVGLGYVGLPLTVELFKKMGGTTPVIGYDINQSRVKELRSGIDRTHEIHDSEILKKCEFSFDESCLNKENTLIIVTVPTPITNANVPDLEPVRSSTKTIAKNLKTGSIIVYESTVYPGVTEEICVPLLEKISGLKYKKDFWVGYSPERINPGDKVNTLTTVVKIVSADSEESLNIIDSVYSKITKTYRAKSIKVAEAAKVIENTQRDVNIALMNELSAIFSRLGIDTTDVINAASTKWNFLKFQPGLVGGHCISVDPYYLTHRAQEAGYIPSLILSAREVNDQMPSLMALRTLQALNRVKVSANRAKIQVLGVTFKEGVPDIRNSKVAKIVRDLEDWGVDVHVWDPLANKEEVLHEYGIELKPLLINEADAVVVAVPHKEIVDKGWDLINSVLKKEVQVVVSDLKAILDREKAHSNIILVRP